jgi:ankyrin repeat protein
MALAKMPLQLLGRLAEYIMEHKIHDYFACTYNSIEEENRCSECLELSPIHFAALYGDIELLKHIEVKIKNKSPRSCVGNTPLHLAAFEGHLEICKWYINNKGEVNNADNDGWTALHYAVKAGQVEVFKYLLENGANVYLKEHLHGQTALHIAAEFGFLKICKMIVDLYKGIDINTKDNEGKTATHLAVEASKLKAVRLLFDKGGELRSRTNEGDTLLHAAVGNGHIEAVKFILPKVTVKNPFLAASWSGVSPFSLAGFLSITLSKMNETTAVLPCQEAA